MNVFSLFVGTVFAFEGIISPLPDDFVYLQSDIGKPAVSFNAIQTPTVLGVTSQKNPIPTPILISITPSQKPLNNTETLSDTHITPTPIVPRKAKQKHMTIAVIGDSMVDTLGPDIPELKTLLSKTYPQSTFTLLNYGVGGTNIDYGIERLTDEYVYLGTKHPSLVSQKPDLTIVESFGYNPYSYDIGAIDNHWLALAKIIDILKRDVPNSKIAIAVTIAPSAKVFGDGAAGLSFSTQAKQEHVSVINGYLESSVKFAESQHLPLMDAYHPSLLPDGNGNLTYINAGDHIHYSPQGREFMAGIMMDTILKEKLLE
jgi:hypothetical protein